MSACLWLTVTPRLNGCERPAQSRGGATIERPAAVRAPSRALAKEVVAADEAADDEGGRNALRPQTGNGVVHWLMSSPEARSCRRRVQSVEEVQTWPAKIVTELTRRR